MCGDFEGTRAAYQRAIDSGHPDYAPKATFSLERLLEEQRAHMPRRGWRRQPRQ